MKVDFSKAKQNMIDCQIRPFSVVDEAVIDVFSNLAREEFVANDQKAFAYTDDHLDLGQGRHLMDPAIFARLLQELNIQQDDQVLDVACGCGYSSTIMAGLGAFVTAIDKECWIEKSKENNKVSDKKPARLVVVDNVMHGCAQYGPYDAIVINGGIEETPTHLINQLRDGGKIATIYRDNNGKSQAVLFVKCDDYLTCQPLFDAFAPTLQEFQSVPGFEF